MIPRLSGLLARAIEPTPESDAFAERILDAALLEIAAVGIQRLTLVDVARRAGVGRVTVYRRFADRESLLEALAQRESRRFYIAVSEAAARAATIEERLTEGFVTFVRFARTHPVLQRLTRTEPHALLEYVLGDDAAAFRVGCSFMATQLRSVNAVEPERLEWVAETLVRIALSFVLPLPSVVRLDDDAAARAYARDCILPLVAFRQRSGVVPSQP
ncbi:TetR/AcrR family transcriptional regulator [Pendulispora brunnea]|uniref:TetR/AcrR family transcriptional regulator n=1 Tax=Pendulispora brunnea TaxID=2905690 RepID=A0ABZ2KBZ1_9BACT